MNTVPLGRSSLRIPRLALGGTTFGREIDEGTSRELLDYGLERGLNLIDSGEGYGGGNAREYRRNALKVDDVREVSGEMHSSENIIGRWLRDRGCRDRVLLCTKFHTGGSRGRVKQALRESLARLQTDYVDIYMLHRPFPDVPIRETLEALTEEVQAGRIRTIGCSNFSAELLREAVETAEAQGLTRMDSTQPAYSLASAGAARALLPYCAEQRIAAITYSPLAAGFLAGKYTAGGEIPKGTRFDVVPAHADVYFNERNFRVVENLRALSTETGEPMVRLAMAWVLQSPAVASVLVGVRHRSHIDNALQAYDLRLDPSLKLRMDRWLG